MLLDVKIDAEAIQQQLVNALTESAIGEQIKSAITKALSETTGDWNNRKTLVQRAVDDVLAFKIRELAVELIGERSDDIRAQLKEKLTEETIHMITESAWAVMSGRLERV